MPVDTPPVVSPSPSVLHSPMLSSTAVFAVLKAIHEVENPRNVETPGTHGELGPYQMTLDTWRSYTLLPFTPQYVCNPMLAQSIALKHIRNIEKHLMEHGRPLSTFEIAVAWNGGIERAYFPERAPLEVLTYALRVEDLVNHPEP